MCIDPEEPHCVGNATHTHFAQLSVSSWSHNTQHTICVNTGGRSFENGKYNNSARLAKLATVWPCACHICQTLYYIYVCILHSYVSCVIVHIQRTVPESEGTDNKKQRSSYTIYSGQRTIFRARPACVRTIEFTARDGWWCVLSQLDFLATVAKKGRWSLVFFVSARVKMLLRSVQHDGLLYHNRIGIRLNYKASARSSRL